MHGVKRYPQANSEKRVGSSPRRDAWPQICCRSAQRSCGNNIATSASCHNKRVNSNCKFLFAVLSPYYNQSTFLYYCLKRLQDCDDDVRSIAAGSLLPIADATARVEFRYMPTILSILWDTLLDLDDLSASTTSIMSLLGEADHVLLSLHHALLTILPVSIS